MTDEPKYTVQILKTYENDLEIFYTTIDGINTSTGPFFTVTMTKLITGIVLNNYATIFGLPEIKESQITYIGPKQIN